MKCTLNAVFFHMRYRENSLKKLIILALYRNEKKNNFLNKFSKNREKIDKIKNSCNKNI